MANKKGYWYTGIYEGYRYKIKNNFLPNEWRLVQHILDVITEEDLFRARRKYNKEISFTYEQLNKFLEVDGKKVAEEIDKIIENFVQRAIWRINVDKDGGGSYEVIGVTQMMIFKDEVFTFSINYLAIP